MYKKNKGQFQFEALKQTQGKINNCEADRKYCPFNWEIKVRGQCMFVTKTCENKSKEECIFGTTGRIDTSYNWGIREMINETIRMWIRKLIGIAN